MEFPVSLEKINRFAFAESGVEQAILPASLRTIVQGAFEGCKNLKTVKFNAGLETLGTDEYLKDGGLRCGVFQESSIERVELPTTLKRIEHCTFMKCHNLKSIQLPERLEYIGKLCFEESALESIILPDALKIIEESTFYECESLKSVVFPNALEKIDL